MRISDWSSDVCSSDPRVRQLAEAEAGWAIRIERDYDPSLPEFAADPDRLTQALWNLLRNALESGAGTVGLRPRAERTVLIGATGHRLALREEITYDGRGVPADPIGRASCRDSGGQ